MEKTCGGTAAGAAKSGAIMPASATQNSKKAVDYAFDAARHLGAASMAIAVAE